MLLRASGEHSGETHDLAAIVASEQDGATIPFARELAAFADAFFQDVNALTIARDNLQSAVGDRALVDAAALVAIYNAVVKIADSTGIPLDEVKIEVSRDLRQSLGVTQFPSAKS